VSACRFSLRWSIIGHGWPSSRMNKEPTMKPHHASLLLLCAATGAASAAPADIARDHDTILRMQGEYAVDFAFDETVLLKPGYERAPAMRSGGNELVVVVEDTPTRVVLQHLL